MENNKKNRRLIWIVSITIPLFVALLFNPSIKLDIGPFYFLPSIYASINAITAVLLISALIAVKKGNVNLHERLIKSAMVCSILFLIGYVSHHITSDTVIYGDIDHNGGLSNVEVDLISGVRFIYYFILITHILLSIVIIPFVLFSYFYATSGQIEKHKKLVKKAFPMWLYVAVTGVIVYFMISPYYPV